MHSHHVPIRELFVSSDMAGALRADADRLPRWRLEGAQLRDLNLLLNGGFFPLKGYHTQADHDAIRDGLRMVSGGFWAVPVALHVDADFAGQIETGQDIALLGREGEPVAIMSVTDLWPAASGGACLGGPVKGISAPLPQAEGPNALRARAQRQDRQRVIACPADMEAPGGALPLDLPAHPDCPAREALHRAVIARNFGATDFLIAPELASHPLIRAHGAGPGIPLVPTEAGTP